jgi:hypothetical protein
LNQVLSLKSKEDHVKAFLSKKVVIGATGLAMLAGAAGAVAAAQNSTGPSAQAQAYLSDLANRLGVTPSALAAAVKAADSDQIDAAVAAGRLTPAEATALKAQIQASTGVPFFGHGLGGHGFDGGRFGGGVGGSDAATANYLGITEATLRSDLRAGQSLAQVATATPGKSVSGLKAAIIAAKTTELNAEVSSGQMTSTQEQQRLTALSSRIDALLQRTWTGSRAWAARGRGGPGLFGSQPAA